MGDRHIYICPKCNEEIYVGGGFNENDDGTIKCHSCKRRFVIQTKLVEILKFSDIMECED